MDSGTPAVGHEMVGGTTRSLLQEHGHGVLSLAAENRAYAVPMSYAFDEPEDRLIFAFINGPDSRKEHFANHSERVTLTTYTFEASDCWESVVVTGTLEPIDDAAVSDRFASLFFDQADDAAGDARWLEADHLDRTWYALEITDISGRRTDRLPHRE